MKRKLLIMMIIMVAIISTGCMQIDLNLEMNSNNTGKLEVLTTIYTRLLNAGDSTSEWAYTDKIIDPNLDLDWVTVTKSDEEYIVNHNESNMEYKGQKVVATFDNTEEFINEHMNKDILELYDLEDGNKGIIAAFKNEIDELYAKSKPIGLQTDIVEFIKDLAGKYEFSITTDYNVIDHNATKVVGNTYTWDLIEMATTAEDTTEPILAYLAYTPEN